MNLWSDLYKLWIYAMAKGPLDQQDDTDDMAGGGVLNPEAIPDIRGDASYWGGGKSYVRLHDSNDIVDITNVTNRASRYKEYDRLRMVPEVETVMTVFADEACVAGDTPVQTPVYGTVPIRWLAENKANDRFLVYCWNFEDQDYTLGWAFDPRKTGTRKAVRVTLDDGSSFVCTPDHRVLKRDQQWIEAGQLRHGSELMPFYRLPANQYLNKLKVGQFPRIFTHNHGWTHERFFIDKWRTGQESEHQSKVQRALRAIGQGLTVLQIAKLLNHEWKTVESHMKKAGFAFKEVRWLSRKPDRRRVLGVHPAGEIDVYDLSVEDHECFASESVIFHNCQKGENDHVCEIIVDDPEVKEESEWLLFHQLDIDRPQFTWNRFKQLCIHGDEFWEKIMDPDEPSRGIVKIMPLPADSMYRIETTRGRLVEFQQAKDGPDYQALMKSDIRDATDQDLQQCTALRFAPDQIVHIKINDDRKTFYPYGVSLIEPARGAAHQLKMMEDAMIVYRLCITSYVKCSDQNGWKYAKDVVAGDVVYSYDLAGKCIPARVVWHGSNGIKPVYRVRTAHTDLTGTETHPVLVRNKLTEEIRYVDLGELKPGVHQFINVRRLEEKPKKIDRFLTEKYARLDKNQHEKYKETACENKRTIIEKALEDSGLGVTPQTLRLSWNFLSSGRRRAPYDLAKRLCKKFNLDAKKLIVSNRGEKDSDRTRIPEYVDEDFARLCGFLIGDEHVSHSHRSAKLLFSTGDCEDINQYYRKLLKKYFGIVVFRQDERKAPGIGEYCVNSKYACDLMKSLGIAGTAMKKRIPSWVFNERKEIRKAFVLGLADADGSKREYTNSHWASAIRLHNKELVEDIKELWHGIGLCSGLVKERWADVRYIRGKEVPAAYSWEVRIVDCPLPQYDDIVGIEYVGEEEVFDLEVDNDLHNFVANGVPIHNSRAPERRVFYIDVGNLAPYRAEAFMERMKDLFKKKKAPGRAGLLGASGVEERWHAPAQDEDYWIPLRPQSNTRVETLPGAQNLSEIDDALFFRNKLFVALNFPKNYLSNEDPTATRITLSAQDVKFARLVERLQASFEYGLEDVVRTHLHLKGFPEECYEDLKVRMTPPSDWRELSRAEVTTNRINNAGSLKGAQLLSDYDILTKWMKYTDDEAKEIIARMKIQKMEDLRLQIIAQNPQLLGVGLPGEGEQEVGADSGGPNPMLAPPEMGGGMPGMGGPEGGIQMPPEQGGEAASLGGPKGMSADESGGEAPKKSRNAVGRLPEPTDEDIRKYDLQIQNYATEQDFEDIDYSELS